MNINLVITRIIAITLFAVLTFSAKPDQSDTTGKADSSDCRFINQNEVSFKMQSIDVVDFEDKFEYAVSPNSNFTFCYEICMDFNPSSFFPIDCLHRNYYTVHQWLLELPNCCKNSNELVDIVNDNKDKVLTYGDLEIKEFDIESNFITNIFGFKFSASQINQFKLNQCQAFCINFDELIGSFPDIEWDIIQREFGLYSIRNGIHYYSDKILGIDLCGCYDTESPTTAPSGSPSAPPSSAPTSPTTQPTESPSPSPTHSPTAEPTNAPTGAPISYGCESISSCIQCAVHSHCVWCDESCYNEEIWGDVVCDENDIKDTESLCPGYDPIANAGWDDKEKLCYDMMLDSCEYTGVSETESLNTTKPCNKTVVQTFNACFWVIDNDESYEYSYKVLGKLISIDTDSNSILSKNQTAWLPPCYLEIRGGSVRNITCPNIPNHVLLETGETELDIGDYYVKKQSDVLLSFIRFLFPRLDASLFYPDAPVIEQDAMGFHAITRVHDHINGTNQSHVHMAYNLEDVVEWDSSFVPNGLVYSQDIFINDNDSHIQRVVFFERLSFDLNGNGDANVIVDMDFTLVSEEYTTESEVNRLLDLLDEFPNGTITFTFSPKLWRLQKYTEDELEFEDVDFVEDDENVTVTRRRMSTETVNGERRRLSPFPFDVEDMLPPGDINDWLDHNPEDMYVDRMRDMLGADARITMLSHEHVFINANILGYQVTLKHVVKGGLQSKAGKLWWKVFDMPQWPSLTGCTNEQGEIVISKASTPSLYHECCNQQKQNYANCDKFKQESDAAAYTCYQAADAMDGSNIADELMVYLEEEYWGNQRYIAAKYRNCEIWGELGAIPYLTVGWQLGVGKYNIFLKGANIQDGIPMDGSGTLQPAYVKELGRVDACWPIGSTPLMICGGISTNIIMYVEYAYQSELAFEEWQIIHGLGLSFTTEIYLELIFIQLGLYMDGLMVDYSLPFRIALDRIDRNIVSYIDWKEHAWTQRYGLFYRVRNWDLSWGNRIDSVSEVKKGAEKSSMNLYQWSLKPYCESLCWIWIYDITFDLGIEFLEEAKVVADLGHLSAVFGGFESTLLLLDGFDEMDDTIESGLNLWNDHGDKVVQLFSWVSNLFFALRRRNLLQSSRCDDEWALHILNNDNNIDNGYLCYDVCILPSTFGDTPSVCSTRQRSTQWTFNIPDCCVATAAIPNIINSDELSNFAMSLDTTNSQWLFEADIHYDECGWFCINLDDLDWSYSHNGHYQDVDNTDAVGDISIPDPCDCDHTPTPTITPTSAPTNSPIWGMSLPPQINIKYRLVTGYPWTFIHIRNMITNKDNMLKKNFLELAGLSDKNWSVDDLDITLSNVAVSTFETYTPATAPPTRSPTNAPSLAPTIAPSMAPSLSPTFCDHDIADWTVDFVVEQQQNVGLELHSSCDDRRYLDYLLKFLFIEIVEMDQERDVETHNKIQFHDLFKNEMEWNYKYGVFNDYIPFMQIYGDSNIRIGSSTETVFSISFFIFYHKFLSELENAVSVQFNITNWPYLAINNTLKMEWQMLSTSTDYAAERLFNIRNALFANLDSDSGPFNHVLLPLDHAEFELGGSNAMSDYADINDNYVVHLVNSLFYIILNNEDDTYDIEITKHYFYNNSVIIDFYVNNIGDNDGVLVYDGLNDLTSLDETHFTAQQSAKQKQPLFELSPSNDDKSVKFRNYYYGAIFVFVVVLVLVITVIVLSKSGIYHHKRLEIDESD